MRIKHEQELGSLRNDISEIKSIFKSGFSNLSAMVAPSQALNQVPNVAPLMQPTLDPRVSFDPSLPMVPPTNHSPNIAAVTHQSFGNSSAGMPRFPATSPPPSNVLPASLPPLSRSYVIPPRRFSGCQACVTQNVRCTHCFLCGQGDHKMEICPRNPKMNNAVPNGVNNSVANGVANNGVVNGVSLGNC